MRLQVKNKFFHFASFVLIQLILWPMRWLPLRAIHKLGDFLGSLLFYISPKFRKRTLNNLSLATDLKLQPDELPIIAKQSLGNLMINCLEYAKFASVKKIDGLITCENPQIADALMKQGTPVIFFCGHQANWEVLFLEGTSRMPGVAIGRPIKNALLYKWLLSIREKFGGKMIAPQNAIREGLRGLKKGAFLGIVGDQGMPDSGYSSTFLGKRAWTSPLPAILSHRTGCPIIVATTRRISGQYIIHYSDPIWPDKTASLDKEIDRLMKSALSLLETSIKQNPGQWLWSHNRWKQQTPGRVKRPFRQESLCIILPQEEHLLDSILPHLKTFREIYPFEFITCKVPQPLAQHFFLKEAEVETYTSAEDLLQPDYRFKLIFDFTTFPNLSEHYQKLAAFAVVNLQTLRDLAGDQTGDLSHLLKKSLLKRSHAT